MRSRARVVLAVIVQTLTTAAIAGPDQSVAGEVLVAPASGMNQEVTDAIRRTGSVILEEDAISGVMRIRVPAGTEAGWIQTWNQRADVRYAERNGIGRGGLVPNDTYFGEQWHLRNTGQSGGTPGADVECVPAWDIATGSSSVGIAVLDTGVDSDHPDLLGRIDPDGFDFVNEDGNPEADQPHGTWVSGCIAANANNDFAVTGVDWGCRILPVKVLDENNLGTVFDLAQGLNYSATQDDVQIISMSLIDYPGSATLITALQGARNAGKILIACAGNGGNGNANQSFPGASPLTMSIGATTRNDVRSSFSGTGNALDFVAPGSSITTIVHGSQSNSRTSVSGCSFATPIAAGIAGLLLDRASALGVELDHDAMFLAFRLGAEDQVGPPNEDTPGYDVFFGHGRLNALRSLETLCPDSAAGGTGGCPLPPCPADFNGSGEVDFVDLLDVLALWGPCNECPQDLDDSGAVDFPDLVTLLASWGPCPQLGACCFPDGACEQAGVFGEIGCTTQGGVFHDGDVSCAEVSCPQPGACCLPDVSCFVDFEEPCVAAGGSFVGDGTICNVDCTQGACCLTDGSCFVVPPGTCDALGGVYQGAGVVCGAGTCP